jgi:hypothetical protein
MKLINPSVELITDMEVFPCLDGKKLKEII